ncbi:MAG: N-6 DNA methylase, partial [Nitrospirae bacterium]|nr:N-6 DNA methylase [Nitrospirota bacterium]
FDGWPKEAKNITLLDPCMGSGHFLVFALPILVAFRMAEEGLSTEAAIDDVLRDNLFGLEIDARCTQIAAFNLALAAWRRVGYRTLPALHLACSGLSLAAKKEDWLALASGSEKLQTGMEQLYHLFQKAPVLGSLINPAIFGGDLLMAEFRELQPLMEQALKLEATDEKHELAVTAKGIAEAAEILSDKFTLVVTNVPYLGRGKQDDELKEYCALAHPRAKADLATCFVERCIDFCAVDGTAAIVSTQYWLFLTTYKKLRVHLFETIQWELVARLGAGAFETISGEVVNVALLVLSHATPAAGHYFSGLDVTEKVTPRDKAKALSLKTADRLIQKDQLNNPNSKLVLQSLVSAPPFEEVAIVSEGLHTGDYPRFGRKFWEISRIDGGGWSFQQGGVTTDSFYSGMEHILFWQNGEGELIDFVRERLGTETVSQWIKGDQVWGKSGVAVGMMGDMKPSLYQGAVFTHGICAIVPKEETNAGAIRAFCESNDFCDEVRKLDQKVCAARDSIAKVPFDLAHWQQVTAEKYPDGLPMPYSSDPTQWLFNGHPKGSNQLLQVAVARLLNYQWPRQTGSSFMDCPALGPDGLEKHVDADGIVCLTPLRGEAPADQRLIDLLADAFGAEWSAGKLSSLLAEVGFNGKTLDDWLRDGFFEQHCALFHQRPFIWHIWDGRRDGFHALVNYHKLAAPDGEGKRTLETLIYTYLGDWIDRQRADQNAGVEGADGRVAAAEYLKTELKKILAGEPPYDIFIRWKPLYEQAIGWEPDINDGVRLNIRPFMTAKPLAVRARGACILRSTPKIKWEKDRGKEPNRSKEEFPWFWSWNPNDPAQSVDFTGGKDPDGNRWNDLHYSTAFKQAARSRKK